MISTEQELLKLFNSIKQKDWIETTRHGDQCLGNTFEDLIEKKEDNLSAADYKDIEIKVSRKQTSSLVTLFSKTPNAPRKASTFLRENYGVPHEEHPDQFVLNTTVTANKMNTHRGGYGFQLMVDEENKKIIVNIYDLKSNELINNDVYWNYDVIEKAIKSKIKNIALIIGDEKTENNKKYVKFTDIIFIRDITKNDFIKYLKEGKIKIDFRIGVYLTGRKIGQTHDHGTAFRIAYDDLVDIKKN